MKTNKEFIDGIYEKYDEYTKERIIKKQKIMNKIVNMAAIILVAISLIVISVNKNETIIIENGNIKEAKISLKTVGNFENFYQMVKANYLSEENRGILDLQENITQDNAEESKMAKDVSNTNTQVENVDEADIVKTDGNYIYYAVDDKVVIVRADKPENLEKIAEISYKYEKFYPTELYINNDKLIVVGSEYEECKTIIDDTATTDVAVEPNKSKSGIILYDITTKTEPKEIRRVEVDGHYVSSRMIENNIYFVSSQIIYSHQILKNNIEDLNEDIYKPQYRDTAFSQEEKCINYDRIYCFEEMESTNYLILVGLNIESDEKADIQTFLGAGQKIYCSEKNMYIATTNTKYDENYKVLESNTHLLKFSLNNGKIKFNSETDINGQINNQFSMDENGEYFRIATTITGNLWNIDENTSNNLYILNDKLEEVGKITGFAKEERIYSVRYVGDKAYIVTFKQTDPLFAIDLSNPTNPQILGELKLPGYSTYLHPYDENHIIGFGYDTKEDGTRITTNGLKMVMFDVTDLNNPKVLFKTNIGDKNTSSEFIWNHKAVLYSKEKNIIAFPILNYGIKQTNSRAVIYEINLEKGFILKGEIQHLNNNYKENIERIVFVNNHYYTLSKSLIKVANIQTLEVVKEIEIE